MNRSASRQRSLLLLATGNLLDPRSGAELRIRHLCDQVSARGIHVHAVTFTTRKLPIDRLRISDTLYIERLHLFGLDLANFFDRLRLRPVTELPRAMGAFASQLRRRIQKGDYDLVQCEFPWFIRLYPAARPLPIIYSAHNVESDWWKPRLARWKKADQYLARLRDCETEAAREAAGLIACTREDRDWLVAQSGLDPERAEIIPNGFDAHRFKPPTPALRNRLRVRYGINERERVMLFVGQDTEDNRQAVEVTLERILPKLSDYDCRAMIVGRVSRAFSEGRWGHRVKFYGEVDDVLPFMQAADVGLNPMTSGSGSNIKLIEYCAAGLPVVTTDFGLRGYEPLRRWVKVASIDEFAPVIRDLTDRHEDSRHKLLRPPRTTLERFTWEAIGQQLVNFYGRILRREAVTRDGGQRVGPAES